MPIDQADKLVEQGGNFQSVQVLEGHVQLGSLAPVVGPMIDVVGPVVEVLAACGRQRECPTRGSARTAGGLLPVNDEELFKAVGDRLDGLLQSGDRSE